MQSFQSRLHLDRGPLCKCGLCSEHWTTAHSHSYTYTHTSGQYGPTNAKHSHTDPSTLYRQQRLLCRGIVREQKRQCVRERRKERITERNFSFCHRLMHDAKPGCKGKPAVGRSVPEHLLWALPPTPMELISVLYFATFWLNSQKNV